MNNIVLIGMPGAGKSTIGVILAKVLGMDFVDSDLLIQNQEGKLLSDIIQSEGMDGYLAIENQVNREIQLNNTIIATGGSVIYCEEAMNHLNEIGTVIYLQLSIDTIQKRIGNFRGRGVVLREEQSLEMLYDERCPLYEKYSKIIVNCENCIVEDVVENISKIIQ